MSFQDIQSVAPAISDTSSPVEKQVWTKPRVQVLANMSTEGNPGLGVDGEESGS